MLHRFLTLTGVPELRAESASTESDAVPEVEVLLPVEKYWEVQEIIKEVRYLRQTGASTVRHIEKLHRLIMPFVVNERERQTLLATKAS